MDNLFDSIFTSVTGVLENSVCTSSTVISDHLVNVDDNRKIANSRWSSLPDDILTMIKDKLDIFDNASVNCACRNWWFASKNYPERHTVGDGVPWILQPSINASGTIEVISIPRKRKIILGVPEFCRGDILFSKQGWLLICLKKISQSSKRLSHYLLLLNPITRAVIKLPKIVITSPGEYENDTKILPASFSICNGRPHFVVLYECDYARAFSLSVTRVGDKMWKNHSYKCQSDIYVEVLIAILVIDQDIYCCYLCGELIVYNVNSQVWKEVAERPENPFQWYQARNYYIEYDKQVVKYRDMDGPLSEGEGLCRFNNSDHTWKELSDDFRNKNIDFDRVLRSFMFARPDCFLESTCLSPSTGNSSDEDDDDDDDVFTELPFSPQMLRRKNIVPFPIEDTMILVDIG